MKPWAHQNSSSLCRRSVLPRRILTQATVPTHRYLRRSASSSPKEPPVQLLHRRTKTRPAAAKQHSLHSSAAPRDVRLPCRHL